MIFSFRVARRGMERRVVGARTPLYASVPCARCQVPETREGLHIQLCSAGVDLIGLCLS